MTIHDKLTSMFRRAPAPEPTFQQEAPVPDWASTVLRNGLVVAGLAVATLLVISSLVVSNEPDLFDVEADSDARLAAAGRSAVPGALTTNTIISIATTLLEKPGGYLSNDIMPPGVWVDNMPNWEFGVLVQVRDISKVMRENFSRSQTQSAEDRDLIIAEPGFNFPNDSWIFPASESQYREAIAAMLADLEKGRRNG